MVTSQPSTALQNVESASVSAQFSVIIASRATAGVVLVVVLVFVSWAMTPSSDNVHSMARTFPTATERGLLRLEQFARAATLRRSLPAEALAGHVENYWSVTWDLPPGIVHRSAVLAHPTLTLAVESGSVLPGAPLPGTYVTGLQRARFDAVQTGRGGVVGAKFRPGGFTVLTGIPATQRR